MGDEYEESYECLYYQKEDVCFILYMKCNKLSLYRVFHDLWLLLQVVIS